jgi:hypothetical protein
VTACRVGLPAADCIADHWLPALGGRPELSGARAPCPVCATARALSIQARGGRAVWCAHCDSACDRTAIGAAIAAAVPCYAARRRRRPAPDLAEAAALALDTSLSPAAVRLGVLAALGYGTAEAADALKLSRATRYRAVSELRQNRRSRGVPILRQRAPARDLNPETKPQVRRSLVTVDRGLTSRANVGAPGSPGTPASKTRVRKARWSSGTCPLCSGAILAGQQIAAAPGIWWAHSRCLIAARQAAREVMARRDWTHRP